MVAAYFAAIYGGPQLSGSRVVTRWTIQRIPRNQFCRSGPRDVEEQTTKRLSGGRSDMDDSNDEKRNNFVYPPLSDEGCSETCVSGCCHREQR